ncbi:hypothetical protein [Commensalibacter nepenthis]|uniref:Uncharacterized protein n=1 Tax=Commensalibacter nepenthis TaxID=3043872 RepID=A0ABT6Q844_9PROT|nr:hypothetical protein [Commensalibacter sp. TBRC 10068]MDI2113078.1 hypothetical protein [Commensalibacter sp. TBRC 10068]
MKKLLLVCGSIFSILILPTSGYAKNIDQQCKSFEEIEPILANRKLGNPNNVVGNCYRLNLYEPKAQWLSPKEVIIHVVYGNSDTTYYITSDKPIEENFDDPTKLTFTIHVKGIEPKIFVNRFGGQQMLHSFKIVEDPQYLGPE